MNPTAAPPLPVEIWELVPPEAQALIQALLWELREQQARIAALEARLEILEARLGQNSGNTSRPPSSDSPPAPRRRRAEPSGRPPGGQPGHERHVRMVQPEEEVDVIVDHWPASCEQCQQPLPADPALEVGEPRRHQVSEIPPVRVEVTEHRRHSVRCPACGSTTVAPLPSEVPAGAFGPRIQAIMALLSGRFRISRREVVELSDELFGLRISLGAVDDLCQTTGGALGGPVAEVTKAVRQAAHVNVDETGWKLRGRRNWLWVAVAAMATVFVIAQSRGRKVLHDLIGADYPGYVGSDRYSAYSALPPERRQVCWAHLRRDFQSLVDYGGRATLMGRLALTLTARLFHRWHQVRDDPVARTGFAAEIRPLQAEFRALLELGEQSPVDKVSGLCRSLLKVWPALWTFTTVSDLEPTNNSAERAVRPGVLWRKGSFGTQCEAGSEFVARMLTVAATARQQGVPLLGYLTTVCVAAQRRQPIPSLLPAKALAQAV